jgi:hypothetical protein
VHVAGVSLEVRQVVRGRHDLAELLKASELLRINEVRLRAEVVSIDVQFDAYPIRRIW